jgi:hypothetical protein
MSFLGDIFGGNSKQISTAVTTQEPPAYAKPYLESGLARGEELFNKPREYFAGQTHVDFDPATEEALRVGEARARSGSPLLAGAQDFTSGVMGGGFTNPAIAQLQGTAQGDYLASGNPYLSAAMQPAIDQVQGQFSQAGRLGSGANMAAMTGALAPIYADNYARERQNQLAAQRAIGGYAQNDLQNQFLAAGAAPALAAADYSDISQLASYGQAREGKAGEVLSGDIARHNFLQNEPGERLANFMANTKGGTFGGTNTQPIYGNPTASAIGNVANLGAAANLFSRAFRPARS